MTLSRSLTLSARLALALAALAATVAPAHAEPEPGFAFNVSYQLQHDNNLFRLPPGADAVALIGNARTSDTIQVKSAGLSFDQRYSLQQVHAEVQLVDYDFQRFSRYDLSATNYKAHWDWAYTPELQGRLLAERSETVNSFDGTATSLASGNRRVQTRHGLDLRYQLDGQWRLQGGLSHRQDRRDQATVGEDDYRQNTVEAGVRRSFGSGSHITTRVGRSEGRNLNSGLVADDRFRQTNLWLDLLWAASGLTTVDLGLHSLSRSHPEAPGLDYSGLGARGSVKWQPTGKLLWTFTAASTLDSYQSADSTHARNNRLGVSGVWSLSARTAVRASVEHTRLQLLGHPSGGATNPRRDRSLDTTVGITWQPDDLFTLDASLSRRVRDSNQALYDYGSTLFSVGLTARF